MRVVEGVLVLSPTDLVGFHECEHLAQLELRAARGELERPERDDPELKLLRRHGTVHEQRQRDRFLAEGLRVVTIPDPDGRSLEGLRQSDRLTLAAMRSGADVIYQAAFFDGRWRGQADFLLRVDEPSELGRHSYEVADTKLARRLKVGAVLQMCQYAEQLERLQGRPPRLLHVILGNGERESVRLSDHAAFYRALRARFEATCDGAARATYPDPVTHCDVCRWQERCDRERRRDDHPVLVAGVGRSQAARLQSAGVETVSALATLADGVKVRGLSAPVLERMRHQARIQLRERSEKQACIELLPPTPGQGLALLPEPDPGDLFFDFEGDPHAGSEGLEYLFGWVDTEGRFECLWAHDRAQERQALIEFVGRVMDRWARHPGMHVYHYADYEKAALKRLAGRHGVCEDEVDRMLRGGLFVDLYRVVTQSLRASRESYSLKSLEVFFRGARSGEVRDAGSSIVMYEEWLEDRDPDRLEAIRAYNEDDCHSTRQLRDWLEAQRPSAEAEFSTTLGRPQPQQQSSSEAQEEDQAEVAALAARLCDQVPEERELRTEADQGRWLLAQLLDWHRREQRPEWWDWFRRRDSTEEELSHDDDCLTGLEYEGPVGQVSRSTLHRYRFHPQEHAIRIDTQPVDHATMNSAGTVVEVDNLEGLIVLRRGNSRVAPHPRHLCPEGPRADHGQRAAVRRVAEWVAAHGIAGPGNYRAVRRLLAREVPTLTGFGARGSLTLPGEPAGPALLRLAPLLDESYLAVQGPPGSGKTRAGAEVIVELARAGRLVGITAGSHRVVVNLLDAVCRRAQDLGLGLRVVQRANDDRHRSGHPMVGQADNDAIEELAAQGSVDVVAGTPWLFARPGLAGRFDHLFIDEAGQVALANVVAVATSARNLILLGDPQQLAHPGHATHPPGSGVSGLQHVLGHHATMPADLGLFLETTHRLHPSICRFISEAFYEDRLEAEEVCREQALGGTDHVAGSGLRYIPVPHTGNRRSSAEEVEAVRMLVDALLGRTWRGRQGERRVEPRDILVVAPYNAQVALLKAALPDLEVGTVDRFQGQEAPVVIYSMATSSALDAPRSLDFLYSLHRLNVAVSRAQGLGLVVASPELFNAHCRKVETMRQVSAHCRFRELAT
ncbi:MAG: TM0106 family RecB-like putative nuclease [Candidatus Dormibacteria bacterium]